MRPLITAQQAAFFSQNGYIEFEISFNSEELFASIDQILATRKKASPSAELYVLGRDLWREAKPLEALFLRKLASIAQALSGKQLRFLLDQWIPAGEFEAKAAPFKELFCIQGFELGVFLSPAEIPLPLAAPLGLLPLPKTPKTILFVKPTLLLDWPTLSKLSPVYFGAYGLKNSVYVHNPNDKATHTLKQLGYHFGDVLKNSSHPLLKL